eukprot:1771087-Prorocentrum_lima.AAC.1
MVGASVKLKDTETQLKEKETQLVDTTTLLEEAMDEIAKLKAILRKFHIDPDDPTLDPETIDVPA